MSKVDWITWKTDPKEIVNPEKVIDSLNEYYQDYNNLTHSDIYEAIQKETQIGGLDKSSLNIYGESPIYDKAMSIVNHMDEIKVLYEDLIKKVSNNLEEQKEEEKKQLIQAIEEKINEEKKILENTEYLKEKVTSNQIIPLTEIAEIISMSKERIKRLQEKLEVVKEL